MFTIPAAAGIHEHVLPAPSATEMKNVSSAGSGRPAAPQLVGRSQFFSYADVSYVRRFGGPPAARCVRRENPVSGSIHENVQLAEPIRICRHSRPAVRPDESRGGGNFQICIVQCLFFWHCRDSLLRVSPSELGVSQIFVAGDARYI